MNSGTIIATLLAEGVEPWRIVKRFTMAGLEIGITLGEHFVGEHQVVSGLAPIDDESDERFARWLAKQAKDPTRMMLK